MAIKLHARFPATYSSERVRQRRCDWLEAPTIVFIAGANNKRPRATAHAWRAGGGRLDQFMDHMAAQRFFLTMAEASAARETLIVRHVLLPITC